MPEREPFQSVAEEPEQPTPWMLYEGLVSREPMRTEWGVRNIFGGVRFFPGGDEARARHSCTTERGETVVFRVLFATDWIDEQPSARAVRDGVIAPRERVWREPPARAPQPARQ